MSVCWDRADSLQTVNFWLRAFRDRDRGVMIVERVEDD